MARTRVIIDITAASIEVIYARANTVLGTRRVPLAEPPPGQPWLEALRATGPGLAEAVRALGAAGRRARVVYPSTDGFAAVYSCPIAAGRSGIRRAARLALVEAATFPIEWNPHAQALLATDRAAAASTPDARQAHVLGAAEPGETIDALWEWTEGAGLVPGGSLPDAAASLAIACGEALSVGEGTAARIVLLAGERVSVLAAASHGRLRFVRQTPVGLEHLAAAYRSHGVSDDRARELLCGAGIPERTATDLDGQGLAAADVLPSLQPVLQRLAADVRQSVRFGLAGSDRDGAALVLVGPGAAIPRLADVLAADAGIRAHAGSGRVPPSRAALLASLDPPPIELVPVATSARRQRRRLRTAAVTGTLLLWAAVLGDGASSRLDAMALESEVVSLRERLAAAEPIAALGREAAALRTAVDAARRRADAALGDQPRWDAVLLRLAAQMPPGVQLDNVSIQPAPGGAEARVHGSAPELAPGAGGRTIKAFADDLGRLPIVSGVRLGAAQRITRSGGEAAVAFDLSITLRGLPADALAEAAPGEEHAP